LWKKKAPSHRESEHRGEPPNARTDVSTKLIRRDRLWVEKGGLWWRGKDAAISRKWFDLVPVFLCCTGKDSTEERGAPGNLLCRAHIGSSLIAPGRTIERQPGSPSLLRTWVTRGKVTDWRKIERY